MKKLFVVVVLLYVGNMRSQTYDWVYSAGSNGDDVGMSVVADLGKNVVYCGWFPGVCTFTSGSGSSNITSAGGIDGDAYIVGRYTSSVSFGSHNLSSSGAQDMFVAHITSFISPIISAVDIQDEQLIPLKIVPIPSQGNIVVSLPGQRGFGKAGYIVTSVTSDRVLEGTFDTTPNLQQQLDVSGLSQGSYRLTVMTDTHKFSTTFIIVR